MRKQLVIAALVAFPLGFTPQLFARQMPPSGSKMATYAEESSEDESGAPPEEIVRKLGAMTPDQKFKRGEPTESGGKVAPKGTKVYPIDILGADDKVLFKAFFFKEGEKWGVFDEAGHVFKES